MRVTEAEIDAAVEAVPAEVLDALKVAADRIESRHRRQLPNDDIYEDDLGVGLGSRWTAIEAVGLYVPGGTASYPSSVLMNAVPAKVAGVERIVMVVPARRRRDQPAGAGRRRPRRRRRRSTASAAPRPIAALAYGTRDDPAGRQDRRPRQRLCRRRQAPGVRHRRHRHDRRPVGGAGGRRHATTIPTGSPPTCWPRPSTTPRRSRSSITDDAAFGRGGRGGGRTAAEDRCRAPRPPPRAGAISAPVILVDGSRRPPSRWPTASPPSIWNSPSPIPEALLARHPQCRRGLPRPPYARGDRRLCRRVQPRAADGALGALLVGPVGARLREAHLDAAALARSSCARWRPAAIALADGRRARRACALGRDPAQPGG